VSSKRHSEAEPHSGLRPSSRPTPLDLERDLPTTPEDVAALRRLRDLPVSPAEYEELLRACGDASPEELARRQGPRGEPFEL